jgi:hypothetical protein
MLREMVECNAPIMEEYLDAFELRTKLRLPEAYRRFILKFNGGRPIPPAFPITGFVNNPIGGVQMFFGFKPAMGCYDIEKIFDEDANLIPHGVLSVACTDGADFICLDLRKSGSPVVYWNRRPYWGENNWSEDQLFPIADDFESFLASLRENPYM